MDKQTVTIDTIKRQEEALQFTAFDNDAALAIGNKIVELAKADKVKTWAEERGHTVAEAAIGWLLAHPAVSSVIIGARTAEQVDANLTLGNWILSPEERDALTAVVNEA